MCTNAKKNKSTCWATTLHQFAHLHTRLGAQQNCSMLHHEAGLSQERVSAFHGIESVQQRGAMYNKYINIFCARLPDLLVGTSGDKKEIYTNAKLMYIYNVTRISKFIYQRYYSNKILKKIKYINIENTHQKI